MKIVEFLLCVIGHRFQETVAVIQEKEIKMLKWIENCDFSTC